MNNPRLQKYSRSYTDQNGNLIEQRTFFLFAGTDMQNGSAFQLELNFHNFDDPKMQKNLSCKIVIDNFTVEESSDIVISLT